MSRLAIPESAEISRLPENVRLVLFVMCLAALGSIRCTVDWATVNGCCRLHELSLVRDDADDDELYEVLAGVVGVVTLMLMGTANSGLGKLTVCSVYFV